MLTLPNNKDISRLEKVTSPYCISIYMPADEDSKDSQSANKIRFKNMVSNAEKQLLADGLRAAEVRKILRRAKELLDENNFWFIRSGALVLLTNQSELQYFFTPAELTPHKLSIAKGYDLGPLKRIMKQNQNYYVLALGHTDIQLFEGDKYHLHDITPNELPKDMKKALRIDEQPRNLETHEVAPVRGQRNNRSYHGQYNVKEEDKKDLVNFFRLLDQKINGFMHKANNPPLILAGIDYLLPLYRQANTYVNLSRKHVAKNIQHMKESDILEDLKPLLAAGLTT